MAVRMEGATPVRISSYALEEWLAQFIFPSSVLTGPVGVSFAYRDGGHLFWVIALPSGSAWVFDATEAQYRPPQECWHERAAWTGSALGTYIPKFHTFVSAWGRHIVGGTVDLALAANGELYTMSSGYLDDDGGDIRYVRALGYVYNEGKRIIHHRIEIEMETGSASTPPTVLLDWSDDRGQTWGTGAGVGTTMTLGPQVLGVYTTRFFAAGLGSSRGRVYRVTITGKGPVAIMDAVLEYAETVS